MVERTKTALVLSAGAPHSPLMAGWLTAILDKNKAFEIIHASGAGAIIGLLALAPKDGHRDGSRDRPRDSAEARIETARQALRGLVGRLGVSDPIHAVLAAAGFPIGYKTFFKPGPFTSLFQRWAQLFKLGRPGECLLAPIPKPITPIGEYYNAWIEELRNHDESRRLWDDLVDFAAAVLTPTLVTPFSKGLCVPLPFLEDMIDFDTVRDFPGHFCVNAYNVSDGADHMETFEHHEITPSHVRAALAYPFIYPPGQIGDKLYFEGADRDPIWFGTIIRERYNWGIRTVVLVDILGELEECLIRPPRNLWDAFEMMILNSVCALANKEIRHFKEVLQARHDFDFHQVRFDIPRRYWPHITNWSHSNMAAMWEIGYKKGQAFGETRETEDILATLPSATAIYAGMIDHRARRTPAARVR